MTTEHPTAAFADQIGPGMVIDPNAYRKDEQPELVTVTAVRHSDPVDLFGTRPARPGAVTVHLIGHYADGRPWTACWGHVVTVHVHAVSVTPDTIPTEETS